MKNIVVGIAYGGFSSEAEVSKKSAINVFTHLKNSTFSIYKLHISKEKWVVEDDKDNIFDFNKNNFSFKINGKVIFFDIIFNAIHGAPGENGQLTAMLELLNIPHTSCNSEIAALTFNKKDCLTVARNYGIATAKSYEISNTEKIDIADVVKKIGLPCFVKPNSAGSSFGISKVYKKEKLITAIKKAFEEDKKKVLIESFLEGREVSVGVIPWKGKYKMLPITEIISDNDFFDYDAKYNKQSKEITPALIPNEWKEKLEKIILLLHNKLQINTFTRSEFIFVKETPHLLDINIVPGLTEESIFPQQISVAGISLETFFKNIINENIIQKKR